MFLSRKFRKMIRAEFAAMASMGPGCFYPGNISCVVVPYTTPGLQWGRDVSIPEIKSKTRYPDPMECFNGAGMFLSRKSAWMTETTTALPELQWGRDVSIPEMGQGERRADGPRCFNGAGMFLSRKYRPTGCKARVSLASMGPGCFYPGNAPGDRVYCVASPASMGPGCFYPGNTRGTRSCSWHLYASMGPG